MTYYILTKDLKIVMVGETGLAIWKKAALEVHNDFASASLARGWYRQ